MEILTAAQAYGFLRHLKDLEIEEFWAIALGPRKGVLASEMLFRGTVDRCPIFPRDVFRFACRHNASALLVAHNHPGGDFEPSREDLLITERLMSAGDLLEIPVVDHLIVSPKGYSSFASRTWSSTSATRRNRCQTRRDFVE